MKRWLKFGLWGIGAGYAFSFLLQSFAGLTEKLDFLEPVLGPIMSFLFLPLTLSTCGGEDCTGAVLFSFLVWMPFLGFAIGSITSLIVDKFKKK